MLPCHYVKETYYVLYDQYSRTTTFCARLLDERRVGYAARIRRRRRVSPLPSARNCGLCCGCPADASDSLGARGVGQVPGCGERRVPAKRSHPVRAGRHRGNSGNDDNLGVSGGLCPRAAPRSGLCLPDLLAVCCGVVSGCEAEVPMKNRLKVLRAERDWSQGDLARRLEVSRQSVNAIETGKFDPSLPLAFKLARLFERPIEEIFEDEEKRS